MSGLPSDQRGEEEWNKKECEDEVKWQEAHVVQQALLTPLLMEDSPL